MTSARAGALATVLVAIVAVAATGVACHRLDPGTTPPSSPQKGAAMLPVRSVEHARDLAAAELARIIVIMVAAADDHTHDPARAHMTTAPCGPKGGYTVDAFDGFLLPPDRHLTVAPLIRQQLAAAGYTVGSIDVTPSHGFQLNFHNSDYEATIASGAGNDSISVYLVSACQLSPDGQFPYL